MNRSIKVIIALILYIKIALASTSPNALTQSEQIVTEILALADVQVNGKRSHDIIVHDKAFYNRILKDQSLGFGESYMQGWWDSAALDDCIFHIVKADLEKNLTPTFAMRWAVVKAKLFNLQSKSGSMHVIDRHYQLGNDLFEGMLDELMTYSCGYWNSATTLADAQRAKYDLIARKLGFKEGMRVLDIGCGWGGFAKYVAENYGVKVVAITLSENQAEYAKKLCAGLPVEVRVQDYRDVQESFDRVVEIGMFEHVGSKNYRTFMEIAYRCLTEGGMLMLHTIGRNTSASTCDPWINKYIFPEGHLPSIAQVGASIEGLFVMEDWHNFSVDYDKTLMAWYQNFNKNWDKVKENYSPQFYRMWKYYLLSCAGAFRARQIQLWQVVLSKGGVLDGYKTVR
ncbi:MAG TPA: cyclopropane fatty acyl phospholipid synthase [Rhabdochlamydiaceae bacterium]|nr:cyclopropane fatty acyl phospholipid synthase [Rhabdochlamydiaceae bacterium]